MPTDPARVRRQDPGDPEKCPVWGYHKIFSAAQECEHVQQGCKSASIGCIECKGILTDNVEKVIAPLREKARPWLEDRDSVIKMLRDGNERARESAKITMQEVRSSVGLPTSI
jgi:tryptophanyl-tRNA synthetase